MKTTDTKEYQIGLEVPLMIIQAPKGMLACAYLDVETFNLTGEAGAIVSGVSNFDDMHKANIIRVSNAASELGVVVGETGASALEKMGA